MNPQPTVRPRNNSVEGFVFYAFFHPAGAPLIADRIAKNNSWR